MSIATTAPLLKTARDEISYWTAVCNSHARSATLKRAQGEGQDVPFEQAFSNLAHAYLKDKAPQLLDFELGFQLLEKNEDNDKAVGVFGFKVGPQWLYAPVFFLNGELKGHELLYLKDSDTFVPLQENWINYILNRKPDVLGEEVNQNMRLLGVERPDVQQFRQTPNKFAAAQEPWLQHGLPGLMWALDFSRLGKPEPAVPRLVKESAAAATLLCKMADARPRLARILLQCYGQELFHDAIRTAKTAASISPTEVEARPRRVLTGSIFPTADQIKQAALADRDNKLKIIRYNGEYRSDLSDAEREQLLKVGHLICDWRSDSETSRLYHLPNIKMGAEEKPGEGKPDDSVTAVQEPLTLQNPDDTNIYEVLVHPEGFEDCIVIHHPIGGKGSSESCVLISKSDPRSWCVEHPANVFTISKYSRSDYEGWFNDLPDATSLEKGGYYVLLGPRGNGSLPFEVEKSCPSSKDGEKCYEVYWEGTHTRRPDHLPPLGRRQSVRDAYGYRHSDRIISIGGNRGWNATSRGGVLYIPDGWKALKIKDLPDDEPMCDSGEPGEGIGSEPKILRPGTHLDLQLGIITKTAELKVWCDGVDTIIDGRRMGKRNALFSLVRDYGLREKAASEALQMAEKAHARRGPGVKFRIKYAQPYELIQSAPNAPGFYPDQAERATDPWLGSGLPTNLAQEWELPVEGMRTASRNELPNNGPPMPDPAAMNQAQQAAVTGQKEVLDTTMLSGLLKGTRREALIDKYLPDLVKGLDRIGRILFNFYWHHDMFEEEYGQQDLHELEDALKNSYESNGDLVLWLKQKTVEPYPGESAPDLQLQAEA